MRRCLTGPLTGPLRMKRPFGFLSRNSWVFAQKYRFDTVLDQNLNCFETKIIYFLRETNSVAGKESEATTYRESTNVRSRETSLLHPKWIRSPLVM